MESHKNTSVGLATRWRGTCCQVFLRIFAFVFTLVAAILMGVDKQTKLVPMTISPNLPPLDVPVVAKWTYLSAFIYFVVINAMGCSYAVVSMLVLLMKRNGGLIMSMMDMLMVALLSSSIGAAGAVGLMGLEGNSHVQWNKVCNVFDKFCQQAAAALALSVLGSLAFLFLPAFTLHNVSK